MFPSCFFFTLVSYNVCLVKAAEQAKASPALVAKDPATATNKKEEEDLAKGKEFLLMWLVIHQTQMKSPHYPPKIKSQHSCWLFEGRAAVMILPFSWGLFVCSYRALTEGAASAATDFPVQSLPQRLQPAVLAEVRWQKSPRHLRF